MRDDLMACVVVLAIVYLCKHEANMFTKLEQSVSVTLVLLWYWVTVS